SLDHQAEPVLGTAHRFFSARSPTTVSGVPAKSSSCFARAAIPPSVLLASPESAITPQNLASSPVVVLLGAMALRLRPDSAAFFAFPAGSVMANSSQVRWSPTRSATFDARPHHIGEQSCASRRWPLGLVVVALSLPKVVDHRELDEVARRTVLSLGERLDLLFEL